MWVRIKVKFFFVFFLVNTDYHWCSSVLEIYLTSKHYHNNLGMMHTLGTLPGRSLFTLAALVVQSRNALPIVDGCLMSCFVCTWPLVGMLLLRSRYLLEDRCLSMIGERAERYCQCARPHWNAVNNILPDQEWSTTGLWASLMPYPVYCLVNYNSCPYYFTFLFSLNLSSIFYTAE